MLLVAVLLLVAGAAVLVAARLRIPTAVGLALAGLALGGMARIEGLEWMAESELTPGVILFVFLPTLLFESAFNIDARRLGENLVPVVILALPVLLVSVVIVGLIVTFGLGMSLGIALVFGALISATDPVAVLSIFREVGAPKRLALLVDGESLFNDGTAFVVFAILVELATDGGGVTSGAVVDGLVRFVVVVTGGLAFGAAAGYLMSRVVERINNNRLIEPTLTVALAYVAFAVADHFLHVSGVMATVAAGLVVGNYDRTKISPPWHRTTSRDIARPRPMPSKQRDVLLLSCSKSSNIRSRWRELMP
ncbi:MAG: cation:proton antiporter, partial [Chloroflexota bacterium]|nr:cation:proton antiporter [Chloroflexota bacterium]